MSTQSISHAFFDDMKAARLEPISAIYVLSMPAASFSLLTRRSLLSHTQLAFRTKATFREASNNGWAYPLQHIGN